jgi:ribosomal protein S18 acetylase RimI-like enzyme
MQTIITTEAKTQAPNTTMPDTGLEIRSGIPESQRVRAAELYYAAFRQKLAPIFRDDERGKQILREAFDLSYAVGAFQDGVIVGIAGFRDQHSHLLAIRPAHLIRAFGVIGGTWRLLALALFDRAPEERNLVMDGLVVDSTKRSLGIGSALIDRLTRFAEERGYQGIRLDVIDTNPRARHLYERKGFVASQTKHYPWLQKIFGFSAVTTMIKPIDHTGHDLLTPVP